MAKSLLLKEQKNRTRRKIATKIFFPVSWLKIILFLPLSDFHHYIIVTKTCWQEIKELMCILKVKTTAEVRRLWAQSWPIFGLFLTKSYRRLWKLYSIPLALCLALRYRLIFKWVLARDKSRSTPISEDSCKRIKSIQVASDCSWPTYWLIKSQTTNYAKLE